MSNEMISEGGPIQNAPEYLTEDGASLEKIYCSDGEQDSVVQAIRQIKHQKENWPLKGHHYVNYDDVSKRWCWYCGRIEK